MQISTIKRAFIKQTIIFISVVTVFSAITWYVNLLDSECDGNISTLEAEVNNIAKQVTDLTSEYSKAASDMVIYSEIKQKLNEKMLTVSKTVLRDIIIGTNNKYYLDNLDVKVGEIKSRDGALYKRKTAFIESSDVTIDLNAISDVEVLGLVDVLSKSFSGIKFTLLNFSSTKKLDNDSITTIKNTGFSPMVKAKIIFTLFGLRDINPDEGDLLNDNGLPTNSASTSAPNIMGQH